MSATTVNKGAASSALEQASKMVYWFQQRCLASTCYPALSSLSELERVGVAEPI